MATGPQYSVRTACIPGKELQTEEPLCSEMEVGENRQCSTVYNSGEGDNGEGSSFVLLREAPVSTNPPVSEGRNCNDMKVRLKNSDSEKDSEVQRKDKGKDKHEKELNRQELVQLDRLFQGAVNSHNWELAEKLVLSADQQTLNDALCIALDSIWFLRTHEELDGITGLIKKIVNYGANNFTTAVIRASFLASCVSVYQSRPMSFVDDMGVIAQRLHERQQECKIWRFKEWALNCIKFHSCLLENMGRGKNSTVLEVQLQLSAFKTFLDVYGFHLTGEDFGDAFYEACLPLALFSNSFNSAWASGTSAVRVQNILGVLVEGGADNLNQCFLAATRFGHTELVCILIQIAQRNNLKIDVELALGVASHYCEIATMECLVEEGNAVGFLRPLLRAAHKGCMQVVQWFVERGCLVMDLFRALAIATFCCQVEIAAYLLPHIPQYVLASLSIGLLKAAGDGSLLGVAFLLRSDFLGDPAATYAVADSIARSDDESVALELRSFLHEDWSEAAFAQGLSAGQDHFVNVIRVLRRGDSPICIRDLPSSLITAIAYLQLYRECVAAGGKLLPQRLRGQLVEAASRVSGRQVDTNSPAKELLAILEHYLPPFLLPSTTNAS